MLGPLYDSEESEASEGASDEGTACLVVLELPGQRRLCAWPLPKDSCHTAASWSWARDKLHVVLPWGWCWGRVASAPLWNYNEYEQEPDFAGISLLNTCTGAVADVELGYHELQASSELLVGPFTPCGLLPVRHQSQAELVWTLFSLTGQALYSVSCPVSEDGSLAAPSGWAAPGGCTPVSPFAAAGHKMLLVSTQLCVDRFYIWHWQLGVVEDAHVPKPRASFWESAPLWSPDSRRVLCFQDSKCMLYDSACVRLSSQTLPEPARSAAWSSSGAIALLCRDALRLYTLVEGAGLSLEHSLGTHLIPVPLSYDAVPLTWSPDGTLLACVGHVAHSGNFFGRDIDKPAVALIDRHATLLGVHGLCSRRQETGWRARWCSWSPQGELRIFTQSLSNDEGVCVVEIGAARTV